MGIDANDCVSVSMFDRGDVGFINVVITRIEEANCERFASFCISRNQIWP